MMSLKPSNVIVTGHGLDEFAYLIDFGIARNLLGSTTTGTLAYMPPSDSGPPRPATLGSTSTRGAACCTSCSPDALVIIATPTVSPPPPSAGPTPSAPPSPTTADRILTGSVWAAAT